MSTFLIAAKRMPGGLCPIGGVQTWSETVSAELRRLGHRTTFWGPEAQLPPGVFDFGIIANAPYTEAAFGACRSVLNVCHGIIRCEMPRDGARHAFTSEGVRQHWGGSGPVIRQPIDLAAWKLPKTRPKPSLIVRYSRQKGLPFLPDLAKSMGYGFAHGRGWSHTVARRMMGQAACVIASGRAAVEAMATGVPVLIADHRAKYQGPLMSFAPQMQLMENYSGRGGVEATREAVADGIERAIASGSLRTHVEMHHDVRCVVHSILEELQK